MRKVMRLVRASGAWSNVEWFLQGDDDEAQGGHFGIFAGRVGENGAMDQWLVNNIYSLVQ